VPPAERRITNPKRLRPDAPGGAEYWAEIARVAHQAGLAHVGVARAETLQRAREQIQSRIDEGLVNGMKFTFLDPDRSTNPQDLVREARTVIVGLRSYGLDTAGDDAPTQSVARIARYAWLDHYGELKKSLTAVAERLRLDGHRATVFADDNSIVDREVAWLSGVGWYGKNANIMVPGEGSRFVVGCIVTTADLPIGQPMEDACGPCTRCLPSCPTGAIVRPGVIDANKCLSWLLQKPGVFPHEYREALGNRIYGCDDCQDACPQVKRVSLTPDVPGLQTHVDIVEMLRMDDKSLLRACDRWYVHERNATWVRRNLLVNLGNVGSADSAEVVAILGEYLAHSDAILRAHAVWAAVRLGLNKLINANDPHEMVQWELSHLPTLRADL